MDGSDDIRSNDSMTAWIHTSVDTRNWKKKNYHSWFLYQNCPSNCFVCLCHIWCFWSPETTHKNACMQIHVSDFKAFAKMPACSSYEKDYTLVFLGLREEEEEEKMGERCKLCIIIIIIFFYLLLVYFSIPFISCMSLSSSEVQEIQTLGFHPCLSC